MTELQPHARSSAANKRVKFIIGGAVIAVALIYLVFTATQSTAAYFLTVEELHDKGPAIYDRNVRVSGKVVGDTIDFNSRDLVLRFEVAGESGDTLPVIFNGPKPDQMRHDAEAIVEGKFDGNAFAAQTLLLKCPSRYEESGFTEEKVEAVR
ncbi:MAG: cytochrome c maturation protein CcmE [Anaerolineae bacterium]|jgi:cytochrome c-type biogenesis protein CcmE